MNLRQHAESQTPADSPPLTDADALVLVQLLDELTACAQRGENPDVHALAAQHPTLAAELRSLWATVWVAETLARDDDPQPSLTNQPRGDAVLPVTTQWPASTEDDIEHGQDLTP